MKVDRGREKHKADLNKYRQASPAITTMLEVELTKYQEKVLLLEEQLEITKSDLGAQLQAEKRNFTALQEDFST